MWIKNSVFPFTDKRYPFAFICVLILYFFLLFVTGVFFIVFALLATVNSIGVTGNEVCRYYKSRGFFSADCAEKKLEYVPTDLKPDIEVS